MGYLFLAGIGNSEDGHWQRIWHEKLGGIWVDHRDWEAPACADWVEELEETIRGGSDSLVIIAHSLGCLLAFEWGKLNPKNRVKGAFLVSVPDPEGPSFPKGVQGFSSPFSGEIPFKAKIVASMNDPYADAVFSQRLAQHWKVPIQNIGAKGHINLKSNLGAWEEGLSLLRDFEKITG